AKTAPYGDHSDPTTDEVEVPTHLAPKVSTPTVPAPVSDTRIDQLTEIVLEMTGKIATLEALANPPKNLPDVHHYALSDVITDLEAREHVLMVGPAGTGKSTIAKQ